MCDVTHEYVPYLFCAIVMCDSNVSTLQIASKPITLCEHFHKNACIKLLTHTEQIALCEWTLNIHSHTLIATVIYSSEPIGCMGFNVSVYMVQLRQQHRNWHCNEWILHSFIVIVTAMTSPSQSCHLNEILHTVHLHGAIATTSLNPIHFISCDRKFMVECEQQFTCQTNVLFH